MAHGSLNQTVRVTRALTTTTTLAALSRHRMVYPWLFISEVKHIYMYKWTPCSQICPYDQSFEFICWLHALFHRSDIITYTPIWVETKHSVDETSPELKRAMKWIITKVRMANNYWLILRKFRSTGLMEAPENIGIAGRLPVGRQQTLRPSSCET